MAPRERLSAKPIKITPAMIDAGASVLEVFDRLEMTPVYARHLAEEVISRSLRVALIGSCKGP
jgi:hypothetical protein